MTVSTIPPVTPLLKFFDNNGAPLAYGRLFTYATATSTKQATYTDSTGNVPNANPIVLNARGEAAVWLDSSLVYKFVLAPSGVDDPPANSIWTQDPIGAFTISQTSGNFSTATIAGSLQAANVVVVGSTIPANGIYLPATNTLGFATNTTARGYIDQNGQWVISAPGASGPSLVINSLGTNNVETLQFPTAGSMIRMARSTDGSMTGFVGSRAGNSSISVYNSGGSTSEVEVSGGTITFSTNALPRMGTDANGHWIVYAPATAGQTMTISAQAANTTNAVQMFTAGSMINFARSSDGSLAGFVGSRATTGSFSVYNSGGTTTEVEADSSAVNIKTNALTRLSVGSAGNVTLPAATSGNTLTVASASAIPAGGNATMGLTFSSTANFGVFCGSGVPTISAAKGSLYLRSDGSSTSTRAYIATDSVGTWTNLTTAA